LHAVCCVCKPGVLGAVVRTVMGPDPHSSLCEKHEVMQSPANAVGHPQEPQVRSYLSPNIPKTLYPELFIQIDWSAVQ
jgi:hypothetical protein